VRKGVTPEFARYLEKKFLYPKFRVLQIPVKLFLATVEIDIGAELIVWLTRGLFGLMPNLPQFA
jgi:hypothetical protein